MPYEKLKIPDRLGTLRLDLQPARSGGEGAVHNLHAAGLGRYGRRKNACSGQPLEGKKHLHSVPD